MPIITHPMTIQDHAEVIALWHTTPGVGLSTADEREHIASFLARNPRLSLVARDGEQVVGAVLCGHDGRRGYIHHLAVRASHRRRGIGRALVSGCLAALQEAGIAKCHLFVFTDNPETIAFWREIGWTQRVELVLMSKYTAVSGG